MPEYIEREALCEYFQEKFEYYKAESEIKVCGGYMYDEKMQYAAIVAKHFLDELKRAPTADVVEVDVVKQWLYKIALNNVGVKFDGDFSKACEEIISRLGGLRNFSRELKEGSL